MAVTLRPQNPAMLELQNLFSEQPRFLRTQEALSLMGDTQLKRHLWLTASVRSSKNKRIRELTEQAWNEEEIKKELVELKGQESAEKAQKSRDDSAEILEMQQQAPKVLPKPKPIKLDTYLQQLENRIKELEEEIKQTEIEVENLNDNAYIRLEEAKKEVNDSLKQAKIKNLNPRKIAFLDKVLAKIEANEEQGISDHSNVVAWFKTVGLTPALSDPDSDADLDDAEENSEEKVVAELARKDSPLRKACKKLAECKDDLEQEYNKLAEEFYEKELLRRDLVKQRENHPEQEWISNALRPDKKRKQKEDNEEEEAYKSTRPSFGRR
jgi:hypothetical protein